MKHTPLILTIALAAGAPVSPREDARRLEVLFTGAPTKNHPGHDPITRYRVLKKHLGDDGINLTYLGAFEALHKTLANLMRSDVATGPSAGQYYQEKALSILSKMGWVSPHPLGVLREIEAFVKLVGGVFKSHGGAKFSPRRQLNP